MANVVALLIIIILTLLAILVIPTLMTRRAHHHVIKIFRHHGALSAETAKTIDEMRLTPPTLQQRLFRTRDYKPRALERLKESGIVRTAEDDKLFLSEEELTLMLRNESENAN
jgi:hypothetical protein